MGRGHAKAKTKAKLPVAEQTRKDKSSRAGQLEKRLAEALEQQTATAEILRAISEAQTDPQPVFDAIARSTVRLCEAARSTLWRPEGDLFRCVARYEMTPEGHVVSAPRGEALDADSLPGRAIRERQILRVNDVPSNPTVPPKYRERARIRGYRSLMAVPMVREGLVVGVITVVRPASAEFTDQQVGLVKTFADQAVIAIENVRLFKELQACNGQLSEALDQQTATSEILRVISASPTDAQPVFVEIARNAARLCDAMFGGVFSFDGTLLHFVAGHQLGEQALQLLQEQYPLAPRGLNRLAIVDRAVVHSADVLDDPRVANLELIRRLGYRSHLVVPMLQAGQAIGVIHVYRAQPGPFSDAQIALLQTFADQAVIAIENVRVFTELQEKNRALTQAHTQVTEALEQQTATSEILRVISQSPTDVKPVFEVITDSAMRLFSAWAAAVFRYEGQLISMAAARGGLPGSADAVMKHLQVPHAPTEERPEGRTVLTRTIQHVVDVENDMSWGPRYREDARARGFRSYVAVPMLRGDVVVGIITVSRQQVGGFASDEISLLQTFADQAVIAIENVRLFKELEVRNRDLTESLEQQTATGEILSVISSSPTDIQPVLDALVRSAVRFCGAHDAAIHRLDGSHLQVAAHHGPVPYRPIGSVIALVRGTINGRSVLERRPVHVIDLQAETEEFPEGSAAARRLGFRAALSVPLLREGVALGTINLRRADAVPFTDKQIALLKTFADQAVIAIENVRLFKELEARTQELTRSVGELRALGEVGQAISSTLDLETVLTTIVSRAVQLSGLDAGMVFEYDEAAEAFVQRAATETGGALAEARRTTRIRKGEGALGRTAITLEPVQVPDITVPGAHESRLREILIESGVRAVLAVPMAREGRLIGCLGVTRNRPGDFPAETVELLRTFATQSALAIQNARLFREIEDKSRQLEVASQHKSEFLANMSHELRTPLNAVIGFSELLTERMFGELNEKQDEYVKDIYASGQHLLSLINDILDLSKIEAGRMELELADFDVPQAIANAVILVRERALRRGITLEQSIDSRLGEIQGDERKVKQVLLNLLSNAIKFTPEGGRIEVRALPADGSVEVSVSDTGVGIAPEDQEAIFEEFRQVGTAAKKVEGTGLGLALARKFIELHGGRIWVVSQVGAGSTFTFTIPRRIGA